MFVAFCVWVFCYMSVCVVVLFMLYRCVCLIFMVCCVFFFSSRRRHTRCLSDWSSDVCSSDLGFCSRRGRHNWRYRWWRRRWQRRRGGGGGGAQDANRNSTAPRVGNPSADFMREIGRASCRERRGSTGVHRRVAQRIYER